MKKIVRYGITALATVTLTTAGLTSLTNPVPVIQAASTRSFKNNTIQLKDVTVRIKDVQFFKGLEKGDANLVVFRYTLTNNSDKDISAMNWYDIVKAYQKDDGETERLETGAVPLNFASQTNSTTKITKGSSADGVAAYRLDNNHQPVILKAVQGAKQVKVGQQSYKVTKFQKQDHKDLNIN